MTFNLTYSEHLFQPKSNQRSAMDGFSADLSRNNIGLAEHTHLSWRTALLIEAGLLHQKPQSIKQVSYFWVPSMEKVVGQSFFFLLQLHAPTTPCYDYNKRTENSELFEVMNILTKITELFFKYHKSSSQNRFQVNRLTSTLIGSPFAIPTGTIWHDPTSCDISLWDYLVIITIFS